MHRGNNKYQPGLVDFDLDDLRRRITDAVNAVARLHENAPDIADRAAKVADAFGRIAEAAAVVFPRYDGFARAVRDYARAFRAFSDALRHHRHPCTLPCGTKEDARRAAAAIRIAAGDIARAAREISSHVDAVVADSVTVVARDGANAAATIVAGIVGDNGDDNDNNHPPRRR